MLDLDRLGRGWGALSPSVEEPPEIRVSVDRAQTREVPTAQDQLIGAILGHDKLAGVPAPNRRQEREVLERHGHEATLDVFDDALQRVTCEADHLARRERD
jgi:hypothetical protein